ncbi:hypothetical protein ZWY2020_011096 [Hordeum vulgare]|nr:hypothetical protein ZWY2020_011096 [Hordeum vulgare]
MVPAPGPGDLPQPRPAQPRLGRPAAEPTQPPVGLLLASEPSCEPLHDPGSAHQGDGTSHPDLHLIYVDEVCGLFKLAGLPEDEVKKKGYIRTPTPPEQIKVEPSIAIIKDLLADNSDGHVIQFCEDAARIAKPHARDKHKPVVGMPVVSVKIGDHCYHGLCYMGASVSAIPRSLYNEIKDEIAPLEMEFIDVTIQLAKRDTICPVGIVRDVKVLCGQTKYPTDFLVLATTQDSFCPIIFGRPFLNTVNAQINCEKQTVTVGFEGVSHEFNFSKFGRQPHEKELSSKDEIIALASISVPPTDPLEQYLLEHENDMHMDERNEIDRVIFEQHPILKNNLHVELLGDPPPPKGDPVFELKQLPDTLKYAYLDEKDIYPVIISANLS